MVQQVISTPIPYQRPIFSQNPLKLLIANPFSGTLHINNLQHMNKLYEIMKEALLQDSTNHANPTPSYLPGQIFATTNTANTGGAGTKPRLFMAIKGQKIFNIIKENNSNNNNTGDRRKSVRIIYNNENDEEYEEEYGNQYEDNEGYAEEGKEEENYDGENYNEEDEAEGDLAEMRHDDIFYAGHSGWDNYTAFK
jgi:hypothetical protein